MLNAPCYGCEFRQAGCHSGCQVYHDYAKERTKFRKYTYKEKLKTTVCIDYRIDSIDRAKRSHKI